MRRLAPTALLVFLLLASPAAGDAGPGKVERALDAAREHALHNGGCFARGPAGARRLARSIGRLAPGVGPVGVARRPIAARRSGLHVISAATDCDTLVLLRRFRGGHGFVVRAEGHRVGRRVAVPTIARGRRCR